MNDATWFLLAPSLTLFGAALVCLLLEAAGTPLGARKTTPRTHLVVVSVAACAVSATWVVVGWPETGAAVLRGLIVDEMGRRASLVVLLLLTLIIPASIPALRTFDAERGEVFALILIAGGAFLVEIIASDLLTYAAASVLLACAIIALIVVDRRTGRGAEAAVKRAQHAAVSLCLLTFGAGLGLHYDAEVTFAALRSTPSTLALLFVFGALLLELGALPAHITRVDVFQGGPSYGSALAAGCGLIAGTVLLVRLVGGGEFSSGRDLAVLLEWGATIALLVPAVSALDQRDIDRLGAHLVTAQTGVVLLPLALMARGSGTEDLVLLAAAAGATATVGAAVAFGFIERSQKTTFTWEAWSGLGREHPTFALALLWLLGSLAGLPGTAGFSVRLATTERAFSEGALILGLVSALAPALALIPLLRLALFLFGKPIESRTLRPLPSGYRTVVVAVACVLVAAIGLLGGTLDPVLEGLS